MHFCSFVDYRPTCGDEPTHPPPALCRGGGEVCYRRPCSRSSCSAFVLVILRSPEDCDLRSVAIFVSVYLSVRTPLAYLNKSSAVAEMGDRGHNRHGPKRGAAVPLSRELGPRLVQCGLGQGLLPYQAASSSVQPFGHNRHGSKNR